MNPFNQNGKNLHFDACAQSSTRRTASRLALHLVAISTAILLAGCRTGPKTANLSDIQGRITGTPAATPSAPVFYVGIRYPAAFKTIEAKLLVTQKVHEMMTAVNGKGKPVPTNPP